MTPEQKFALEALAGRSLTAEALAEIKPLIAARNDAGIAAIISAGRTRMKETKIGVGTILASFQGMGGAFLDALTTIGQTNRDVHWLLEANIKRGDFDIGHLASRAGIAGLIAAPPLAPFVPGMNALLALGTEPHPVSVNDVSNALNALKG